MKSLLRLLKHKALSVNSKKTNGTASLKRSPFAAGLTNIEAADACAESATCQPTKPNALADLAQRVSSEAEYGVTSAEEFLSGTKSFENDEKNDEQQPTLKTHWPFPSFSLAETDQEISFGKHAHTASKNGGFEFIVPREVSVEDSHKLATTLFKWGTLDAQKKSESRESAFNNLDHHYDTWEESQSTPFDKEPQTPQIPLCLREDSAHQSDSTNLAEILKDENGSMLPALQRSIKKAKVGAILDLNGMHIVEQGSLQITTSDITLQNGTLELTQGLSVNASRVKLFGLTLISKSSKAATLRVSKKDCCLVGCDISNAEGVGVQVTSMGSSLTMQQTTVHDCDRSCVCVNRAGILRIGDGCLIHGSRSFHGISATDAGTELWIEDSKIFDNFQDGIYVTSSAHAALENCEIYGSRAFHGIAGKKFGTTIVLKNCQLHGFRESAVFVEMGAKAKITDSHLKKCINGHGVVADGHGSHVDIFNCEIGDCDVGGVLIQGNATSKITRTHIYGSSYGNGVVISEQGSFSKISNSVIFQNCRNGVLVTDEGKVTLEDCDVSSSTVGNGVFVRGGGSASLTQCQMSKNNSSNLCADSGATCYAAHCRFYEARNGPSVLARGQRTSVDLFVLDEFVASLEKDIYMLSRAKIVINENKCRNRQKWPKLKQNNAFSRKMPFADRR